MIEFPVRGQRGRCAIGVAGAASALLVLAACSSSSGGTTKAAHAPSAASGTGVCQQQQSDLDANPTYAALVSAAADEKTVNWANGLTAEDAKTVTEAFHKAFPCVTVKFTRQSDDDSRQRLLREMKAGTFNEDVMDISGSEIPEYQDADLMKKVDWKSAFPSILDTQLDPDGGAMLSVGGSIKVVAFNTNVYKAGDLPENWEGFTEPKWKGKFELDSKPKVLYQLVPAWGLDKVVQFTGQLKANKPQLRRGQNETMQLVAAGEIDVAIGMSYQDVKEAKDQGAPVDYKFIEPVPVSMEQEVVLSGAPHTAAAELLLGWLATKGNVFYDEVTNRGLPFKELGTSEAKLLAGKQLSLEDVKWSSQEDAISDKVLPALGVK